MAFFDFFSQLYVNVCFRGNRCNWILDAEGNAIPFTTSDQESMVANVIEPMACDGLRTICIAYKDFVHGKGQFTPIKSERESVKATQHE